MDSTVASKGRDIAQASTTDEALPEYRRVHPDLVPMDQRLPGTNGTEALKDHPALAAGQRHIPADVAGVVAEHIGPEDLTPRELQILRLIRDGHRNNQIADQLSIPETTVNLDIKNIVEKLQANDKTHSVTIALRRALLQLDPA